MARRSRSGCEHTSGPHFGLGGSGDPGDVRKGGTAMADTQQRPTHAADDRHRAPRRREPTAWVGFVLFGGIMLVMLGGIQIIEGLVALFKDEYFLVARSGLVLTVDYAAWGWTHLLIGVIAVLTGIGVMFGQMWARVVGIVIAVISAVANLAFIAAYPVWCTIVIALDVLVIYALAVHGRELRAD
jgi:hypothetical protein